MAVYVMSDLHGLKHRFNQMLEMISFSEKDELYILGDAIDRGPEGITLLLEIMKHSNMHMMMGNHEHMMLEYFEAINERAKGGSYYAGNDRITRWNQNHNQPTLEQFQTLSKDKQRELLNFLYEAVMIYTDVSVKNRHFYLVHAAPYPAFTSGVVRLMDCEQAKVVPYEILWERMDKQAPVPENRILIFGHTPTMFFQPNRPYAIWTNDKDIKETDRICIDCGCAVNNEYTRLACVRLDDLEVFYA